MARLLTLVCLLLVLSCTVVFAADWPMFMGPTRNGLSPETGLNKDWAAKPPPVLWQLPLSDNGYAGPSVADGKVFIIDHAGENDVVRAVSLDTGKDLWQYAYPDTSKHNYGYARSTPTFDAGKLYVAGRLGQLICLNASDGKAIWGKNLVNHFGGRAPGWDYAGSPLIDGERLIICTGSANGSVICLDKNTGETLWTGGNSDVAGHATAVIANLLGQKQYVVATASSVIGVAPDSGKLLWAFPWENKCKVNASQPLVEGNFVFITSGYGIGSALYEITAQGPVERWKSNRLSAHFSSPLFYNGFIYSDSDPGNLVCMSPQDGQVAWLQGGFEKGGLLIADGVIIMLSGNNGDLVLAKAASDGYQELGRIKPLGGQSWTAPILANGRLIIRNTQGLACLDLR